MLKKWSNIQCRVKEKFRERKTSGGGPAKTLSKTGLICCKILGEDNPKLKTTSWWISQHDTNDTEPSTVDSGHHVDATSAGTSSDKRKVRGISTGSEEKSLDELHREVLILQKEKLRLQIKKLKAEVEAEKHDQNTHTFSMEYPVDSLLDSNNFRRYVRICIFAKV